MGFSLLVAKTCSRCWLRLCSSPLSPSLLLLLLLLPPPSSPLARVRSDRMFFDTLGAAIRGYCVLHKRLEAVGVVRTMHLSSLASPPSSSSPPFLLSLLPLLLLD